MAQNWYFFHQNRGKEDVWQLAMSSERQRIVNDVKPAFCTALDLSSIPDDNDWTKVRYQGAYYVDFDAEGNLKLACEQVQVFLFKLEEELGFDYSQARFFASGSKGFHVEIPETCFMPKPPPTGTAWLPYIYREMSQSLHVDTLDLNVYTGKRGRQWRTVNVKRENGMYKVPLTVEEILTMEPELYEELIKQPRPLPTPTPPNLNTKFALLYDRSKEKVVSRMRGKKKRQDKAVTFLEPWKKAKQTPPSIAKIMNGDDINSDAGFQSISMQLAIYATSVGMSENDFIDACQGLCEKHVSDSRRYNSIPKRQDELRRMWRYMEENTYYDFEVGPLARLLDPRVAAPDLGVMSSSDDDDDDGPPAKSHSDDDDEEGEPQDKPKKPAVDEHRSLRKGFSMSSTGMYRTMGEVTESVCRATMKNIQGMFSVEETPPKFQGYEVDLIINSRSRRVQIGYDTLTSAMKLKQLLASHQVSYQGTESDTTALMDIMNQKLERENGKVFVYPREGFFIIRNPKTEKDMVLCYLTQNCFLSSLPEDHPDYFRLQYRPITTTSSYNLDLHEAPELNESMIPHLWNFFSISRDDVMADVIGWAVAAHYRSLYIHYFGGFPVLHLWGEAGAGKSKTAELIARLHWFRKERVVIKSATSSTNFALDIDASSSTSAPMIIDEWKPKELREIKGRYVKLKDVIKATYNGQDIGNRGGQWGAQAGSLVRSKATAPIMFMAEAIESETAIFERSITVALNQDIHKGNSAREAAFLAVYENEEACAALSALGREIIECGFGINIPEFVLEVQTIRDKVKASLPPLKDGAARRAAPRMIFNRVVIIHAWTIIKRILHAKYGPEFDEFCDRMIAARSVQIADDSTSQAHSMSEISKTLSRIALLSRHSDDHLRVYPEKDYIVGDGWVEIKAESCYDRYRRYCASINDTPLFDSLDAFVFALGVYSPTLDRLCVHSELREAGSTERIFRLDLARMTREGVQSFRT